MVTLRGHPTASSNDRPSGREDAPASECAPEKYQPGCEGDRAVAALSPTSGPMAGVGQGTVGGLPPRTQRTQTQPAGQLAAHRAGGSEALASGA